MLSDSMVNEMNISSLLDTFVYLDDNALGYKGKNLGQIMSSMSKNSSIASTDEFKAISQAIKQNPDWAKLELIDMSSDSTPDVWHDDLIQGVCFKDPSKGDYYVAYRGTGDGRWVDNGAGMTAASTQMQEAARDYFDGLFDKHPEMLNVHKNGGRLIVTGHSKGGNEAQYVTFASEHEYLIDNCYNFDGQGFSKKANEKFIETYGEDYYNRQRDKMYSICGENDFVHDLGYVKPIPEDHTYYVGYVGEYVGWHAITNMLLDENGNYTGIVWNDANGGHGEQGEIGKLTKKLNDNMQRLDDDDLDSCARVLMLIVDRVSQGKLFNGDEALFIGDEKVEARDYIRFIGHGAPLILWTLVSTPEGRDLIYNGAKELVLDTIDKYGPVGGIAIMAGIAIISMPIVKILVEFAAVTVLVCNIVEFVLDVIDTIKEIGKTLIEVAKSIADVITSTINNIRKWAHDTFNAGARYSNSHTYIYVDTNEIRSYATQLYNLNNRLINLESRIHALYGKLSLSNQGLLQSADKYIGSSNRLKKSQTYLNQTAELFSEAERKIEGGFKS